MILARDYDELYILVYAHLSDFYEADRDGDRIPWPDELADAVGWTPND